MSTYQFETIETPAGAFIGWHDTPGQVVTGKVVDYDQQGGQDFAGHVCPQVTLELVEPASSFNKAGDRSDFAAGEFVTITAGQANLKKGIIAARPEVGDILRVTHSTNANTANGTAKIFEIQIARIGGQQQEQAQPDISLNPQAPAPFPGATPTQQAPFVPNPAAVQAEAPF